MFKLDAPKPKRPELSVPATPAEGALRLRDVVVRHGQEVRLSYPSIDLAPKTQAAITGPSGTGKTTLLHLIAGLLVPFLGIVQYGQQRINSLSEIERQTFRRREVGYMLQDFHLMSSLTALENVELGLRVSEVEQARTKAIEVLKKLDLGKRLHHYPAALSTGERQRVALARAVAHRPRLLLVDEPTAHLDPQRTQSALELLINTATELGATMLVVTHDLSVARAFSARVDLGEPLSAQLAGAPTHAPPTRTGGK